MKRVFYVRSKMEFDFVRNSKGDLLDPGWYWDEESPTSKKSFAVQEHGPFPNLDATWKDAASKGHTLNR